MQIEEIDSNFAIEKLNEPNVVFHDAKQPPFSVYGVFHDGERYRRMPADVAASVSNGVRSLACNTSGGRVRFSSDSPYVAIHCMTDGICDMAHMTRTGEMGFSIYANGEFCGIIAPPPIETIRKEGGFTGIMRFADSSPRDITVYMPLYNNVTELFIGTHQYARLGVGDTYRAKKPLLFYGSSITQGGCASRPGNSYDAIVARLLDMDYINLGFSGCGKAEPAMAEYLAGIDCSVFICDYDYNAPDAAYLTATHYRLYKAFRNRQPNTPIILMSKPDFKPDCLEDSKRRKVIRDTYISARAAKDQNIYMLDGSAMFGHKNFDCCTVDGCHPNDLGFERIAMRLYKALKLILSQSD